MCIRDSYYVDDGPYTQSIRAVLTGGGMPRVVCESPLFMSVNTLVVSGGYAYFTTGEDESRAWIFPKGAKAPECAGVIHSDLQRGFIKADVIRWDELLEFGSLAAARQKGKVRLEGKEYVVQDGDVLEIRFNV